MHHRIIITQMGTWGTQHNDNLSIIYDVCLLSIQQVMAILTFFSKSFSFSVKVLVRYQSQAFFFIFSMKLTTLFALHSQKVWIHTCMQCTKTNEWQKGVSPLWLAKHTYFCKRQPMHSIIAKCMPPNTKPSVTQCTFTITNPKHKLYLSRS